MCYEVATNKTVDAIGYTGGIVLSVCMIPQIYKIYKTKNVENISYSWQIMYIFGIAFHLYYSIYYKLLPILIPTVIEICFTLIHFVLMIVYKNKKENS